MKTTVDIIRKEVSKASGLLKNIVRRGMIRIVSSSYFCQVEGNADELYDDVELWQHYGFASRPPRETECLITKLQNSGNAAIVTSTQHRDHRPVDLDTGDVCLYGLSSSGPVRVMLKASGNVDLESPSGTVNVGGSSEFLLLGESVKTNMATFSSTVIPLTGQAPALPATMGNVDAVATAMNAALLALNTATAGWLASKGKVT